MAFWNPDAEEPLFTEEKPPDRILVRNIETGEMVPIEEIDVGGLNSDLARMNQLKNEPLVLGEGESPTVLIELHFEATNNYTRNKYPIKVKSEKKFAQPWTLKLHKQSTYDVKVKLSTTAHDLNIDGIEDMTIEGTKVVTKPPKILKQEQGVSVRGTWNLPVTAHSTADTHRHALPLHMVIKVSRRNKFLMATFNDAIQAKIYSENVNNIHTGQALEYLMLGCDLKTQSSGGINYIIGN